MWHISSILNLLRDFLFVCLITRELLYFVKCFFASTEGFPGGTSGKELVCQCRRLETLVQSLGGEDPLEEAWQPTPVFLPRESHGQRSRGLQSIALQSFRHHRSDLICTHASAEVIIWFLFFF